VLPSVTWVAPPLRSVLLDLNDVFADQQLEAGLARRRPPVRIAGEMADADRAVLAEIVDFAARIRAQAGIALWCLFVTRRPGT